METLTEFFRELVAGNETKLKESTENYKDADERLKCQLGSGVKDRVDKHMRDKYHYSKKMNEGLRSVNYFKRMMVAAKGLLMPQPTPEPARLYVGSDEHPRICKEFDFWREDGVLTNQVRIHSIFQNVEWSTDNKVSRMQFASVRYLKRPRKNLAIPHDLLQWMVKSADWWTAIEFCLVNVNVVYSMIEKNVGRYAGVDGHRNVVCGCAYDANELQFVVSTSRPHYQSWVRTIDFLGPVVFLQNVLYIPIGTTRYSSRSRLHGDETDVCFESSIHIGGHDSRTYLRGPKRFHKAAARSIWLGSEQPIKATWP